MRNITTIIGMLTISLILSIANAASTVSVYENGKAIAKDASITSLQIGSYVTTALGDLNALKITTSLANANCIITPALAHEYGFDLLNLGLALKEGKISGFWRSKFSDPDKSGSENELTRALGIELQ